MATETAGRKRPPGFGGEFAYHTCKEWFPYKGSNLAVYCVACLCHSLDVTVQMNCTRYFSAR